MLSCVLSRRKSEGKLSAFALMRSFFYINLCNIIAGSTVCALCLSLCLPILSYYACALTPWNTAVLDNLIVTQLVKKLPSFYGTCRFIMVFTSIRRYPLESSPFPSLMFLRSILIFSSNLRLCALIFLTRILHAFLFPL